MKLHKYTEAQLRDAVQDSTSMRQALMKLSVAPFGGNYDVLRKAIAHFQIDSSHFLGKGWNIGCKYQPKRPLASYLSNQHPITSHKLRLRLIKEGIFEHKCSSCKKTEWMNRSIPLELDHIDGNNKNNQLNNLRILCPNCHALTPTYRGKNKKSPRLSSGLPVKVPPNLTSSTLQVSP